jgi:hypothetical protein
MLYMNITNMKPVAPLLKKISKPGLPFDEYDGHG